MAQYNSIIHHADIGSVDHLTISSSINDRIFIQKYSIEVEDVEDVEDAIGFFGRKVKLWRT